MIFALGFLLSALLSLLILPAFWRRALRLSARRLEMLMPLSMDEIHARRDQIRAQAAVEQRRIEQRLEAMTRDRARHMGEIGRSAGTIVRLEAEIGDLKTRLRERDGELRAAWCELGALHIASHDLSERLRDREDAHSQLKALQKQFDILRVEKATLELGANSLRAQAEEQRQRLAIAMEQPAGQDRAAAIIIAAHECGRTISLPRTDA